MYATDGLFKRSQLEFTTTSTFTKINKLQQTHDAIAQQYPSTTKADNQVRLSVMTGNAMKSLSRDSEVALLLTCDCAASTMRVGPAHAPYKELSRNATDKTWAERVHSYIL